MSPLLDMGDCVIATHCQRLRAGPCRTGSLHRPTGNLRGTCNDATDAFNRTDYDWVFDNNIEWVIDRAIVDDTTDVSAEDTAPLGLGSDPLYQWWGTDTWFVSEQRSQSLCWLYRPHGLRYGSRERRADHPQRVRHKHQLE